MTTQPYRLRPGYPSDVPHIVDIFLIAFGPDRLLDFVYPNRRENPEEVTAYMRRLFQTRWWTPNYDLQVVVGAADGIPVGFTWWKRPNSQLSFYESWISPYAWVAPIVRAFLSLRNWLFPIPNIDEHASNVFVRVFKDVEPQFLNTPRSKSAWYLSTLAVRPELHGKGLGGLLMRSGLQRADECGAATWLVSLKAAGKMYERYDYVEVARANVGELEEWDGGAIMMRNK